MGVGLFLGLSEGFLFKSFFFFKGCLVFPIFLQMGFDFDFSFFKEVLSFAFCQNGFNVLQWGFA